MPSNEYDSSPTPLDDAPLSRDELRKVRGVLRDVDRATWLRRQLKVFAPWLFAVVSGVWALADWASKHIKWGSP